jgi:hemerythrin-like domain-containing protein
MPSPDDLHRMHEALAVIESEHAALAAILSGLRYFVRSAARGCAPDPALLDKMLDYVEFFPERLHHPREDGHLFRRLRARTHEMDDMLDRLEAEHAAGHARLAELRDATLPAT